MREAVRLMLMGLAIFGLACSLTRCGVPVGLGVATFSTAALMGAGVAIGAGAVDVGWANLPGFSATPSPIPTAGDVAPTPETAPTTSAER